MMLNNVYIKLLGTIVMSIGLMVILFLSSEEQVHRNNAFIRRFPPHPVIKEYDIDLGFNSYYVAGLGKDMVYLGNSTAPLHLLKINLATRDTAHVKLKFSDTLLIMVPRENLDSLRKLDDVIILEELDIHLRYEKYWWVSILIIPISGNWPRKIQKA